MSFLVTNDEQASPGGPEEFNTTHWSMVLLAGQSQAPHADAALERLCRTYWNPLYGFVRRQGHNPHDAQDLTQEFFARLLEKKYLALADPERGRFRSFLLKSLKHFLVNEWERGRSQRRGGGREILSIDDNAAEQSYRQQPAEQIAPDSLYDKLWAITVLERAIERLGGDYAATGRRDLFDQLSPMLLTAGTGESYREAARPLGMSEGALKVAMHRLRQRFRDIVRAEIAQTVATPGEVDGELRCLMAAMSG